MAKTSWGHFGYHMVTIINFNHFEIGLGLTMTIEINFDHIETCRNPTLGLSVRMQLTFPKVGKWSPPGLPNVQSSTARLKTPRIGVFLVSLERS